MSDSDSAQSNRRSFQVYLAASLLLIVVVSIGAGWWVFELRQARRREAVASIEELGGDVTWEKSHSFVQSWLRPVLGDDFADEVVAVHLGGTAVDNAELAQLTRLGQLRCLYLHETSVSDSGLAHLSRLKNLQRLGLRSTQVTDAGLAHLAGRTKLECLDLENTQVSDVGLTRLTCLTNLELLILRRTQVTKTGVVSLQQVLPKAQILR